MHSIPSQKFPLCNNKYYLQCACPSSKNEQQAKTCTQCKIRLLTWQTWQEQQVVILFEQSHMRNSLYIKKNHIFYYYINTLQHFIQHLSHHSQHVMWCNMCVCRRACMCVCISLHACLHEYAWSRDKCSNQHPYKFPEPVAQWVYSLSDGSSCAISRRIV